MRQYIGEQENPEEKHNTHWTIPTVFVYGEFTRFTLRMRLAYCTSCTTATDHELPMMTLEVGNIANTFFANRQTIESVHVHVFYICRSCCQRTTTTPCAALRAQGTIISKQPLNWSCPVRRRPKSGWKTSRCHQASYGEHLKLTQSLGDTTSIE